MASTEEGLLKLGEPAAGEQSEQGITAIHHRGNSDPGDDRENAKALHDFFTPFINNYFESIRSYAVELKDIDRVSQISPDGITNDRGFGFKPTDAFDKGVILQA